MLFVPLLDHPLGTKEPPAFISFAKSLNNINENIVIVINHDIAKHSIYVFIVRHLKYVCLFVFFKFLALASLNDEKSRRSCCILMLIVIDDED